MRPSNPLIISQWMFSDKVVRFILTKYCNREDQNEVNEQELAID